MMWNNIVIYTLIKLVIINEHVVFTNFLNRIYDQRASGK